MTSERRVRVDSVFRGPRRVTRVVFDDGEEVTFDAVVPRQEAIRVASLGRSDRNQY